MASHEIEGPRPRFVDVYRGFEVPALHLMAFRRGEEFVVSHDDIVTVDTPEEEMRRGLDELVFITELFAKGFEQSQEDPKVIVKRLMQAMDAARTAQKVAGDLLDVDPVGPATHGDESFTRKYAVLASAPVQSERSKKIFIGFQECDSAGRTPEHQHTGYELYLPIDVKGGVVMHLDYGGGEREIYLDRNFQDIIVVLPGDIHSVEFGEEGGKMLLVGGSGFGVKDYSRTMPFSFSAVERHVEILH